MIEWIYGWILSVVMILHRTVVVVIAVNPNRETSGRLIATDTVGVHHAVVIVDIIVVVSVISVVVVAWIWRNVGTGCTNVLLFRSF